MDYNKIVKAWEKSDFTKPTRLILVCRGNNYAVIDDSTTIITIVSKGRVVYAVAKSKVIPVDEGPIPYYEVDYVANLKVISCTENASIKPVARFVFENILPNI